MRFSRTFFHDLAPLLLLGVMLLALHAATNGRYGFHRDELSTLSDASELAWGYVGVPPLTPFLARVAFALFGPSLVGLRLFSSLAMSIALMLTGLMARQLGGSRRAQIVAAIASAISPVALSQGTMFEYVSLDYLWWVAAACAMTCLLASDNPRWCLGIGAAIGAGMMTKYTMAFFAVGIGAGFVLTPARRYVRNPYFWGGVALAVLIVLPHILWEWRHDFISLDFLKSIHARDVRLGRDHGFLLGQFLIATNVFTVPLWIAGLYFIFFDAQGQRFRALGWMFVVPLVLFVVTKGRDYYLAPAYPMLLAAGAVWCDRIRLRLVWVALAVAGVLGAAPVLPVAPVGSAWWRVSDRINGGNFNEELGWPELVATIARVRDSLPAGAGILVADTGQAEAIALFGEALHLPRVISGTNSLWFRGYGEPPPKPLIVVGLPQDIVQRELVSCRLAARIDTGIDIQNSSIPAREIFVCEGPRQPWPQFWQAMKHYA